MTWLLKIKRRAQNAAVAWLDLGVERPKRPSGDLLRDEADGNDRFEQPLKVQAPAELARLNEPAAWPGEVIAGQIPGEDAR